MPDWFSPTAPPDPAWMVHDTRDDATTVDGLGRNLLWNRAWKESMRLAIQQGPDACNAYSDAGEKAWQSVRIPVPAWVTGQDGKHDPQDSSYAAAEWEAARDASLLARVLTCEADLDPDLVQHARDRWEVWERGYGLLCDLCGVLIVYRQPKPQPQED